jgi:hypothetical protein
MNLFTGVLVMMAGVITLGVVLRALFYGIAAIIRVVGNLRDGF